MKTLRSRRCCASNMAAWVEEEERSIPNYSSISRAANCLICHHIIFPHHFNFKVIRITKRQGWKEWKKERRGHWSSFPVPNLAVDILQARATYRQKYLVSLTMKQFQTLPAFPSCIHPEMPLIWGNKLQISFLINISCPYISDLSSFAAVFTANGKHGKTLLVFLSLFCII